jgi:hypothetical protein
MSTDEMQTPRVGELIRLVERDYDQTAEFIRSIIGTISTIRGWSVTVWLAVLGVSVNQESVPLAVLAALLLLPFTLLDLYHSWLYSEALRHARVLERVSRSYYSAIERGNEDVDLILEFEEQVTSVKFGLYGNFRRFQWPEIKNARPTLVFRLFYPGLAAAALLAAALIALFS